MRPPYARFLARTMPADDARGMATCAVWLPCNARFVVGTQEGMLIGWSKEGAELWASGGYSDRRFKRRKRTGARQTKVRCLDASEDGVHGVAGCYDHRILLVNADTGRIRGTWAGKSPLTEFLAVAFSPDGSQILATTSTGRLYHWHTEALARDEKPTWTVALSSIGSALVWPSASMGPLIGCEDGTLQTRDLGRRRTTVILREQLGRFHTIDVGGGAMLCTTDRGLWHLADPSSDPSLILEDTFMAACWSGEDGLLASLHRSGEVTLWHLEGRNRCTGEARESGGMIEADSWFVATSASFSHCLAGSPDGLYLVTSGNEEAVTVWCAEREVHFIEPDRPEISKLAPHLAEDLRADSSEWSTSVELCANRAGELVWTVALPVTQSRPFIADHLHVYLDSMGTPLGALRATDGTLAWQGIGHELTGSSGRPASTHVGWLEGVPLVMTDRCTVCFEPDGSVRWLLPEGVGFSRLHTLMGLGNGRVMHLASRRKRMIFDVRDGAVFWGKPHQDTPSRALAMDAVHSFWIDEHRTFHRVPHDTSLAKASFRVPVVQPKALSWFDAYYLVLQHGSGFLFIDIDEDEVCFDHRMTQVQQVAVHPCRMIIALDKTGALIGVSPFEDALDWRIEAPEVDFAAIDFTLTPTQILLPRPGSILCIDPRDGSVRFEQPLDGRTATAPVAVTSSRLYVACDEDLLAFSFDEVPSNGPRPGSSARIKGTCGDDFVVAAVVGDEVHISERPLKP